MLAEKVAMCIQAYTLYGSVRPLGVALLLAGVDASGPGLFMVEPSGVYHVCIFLFSGI